MNNLYNLFNKAPMGNMGAFMSKLNEFRRTLTGNPQEMVQELLRSGKVTQAQYDQAVQLTNQIMANMK